MKKATKKGLTMWQYMCYMCAIILMLCGITFLLSSCTEEIITNMDKPKGSGKMVEVNFVMNSSTVGDPETVTTRNARDMQPETVEVPLGDDLFMYATLDIDCNIKLRATQSLAIGKQLCIVAYKAGSAYPNDGYADYTVIDNAGNISGGSLMVEEGEDYTFVAYTFNSPTLFAHQEVFTNIPCGYDLLWGATEIQNISNSTTVHITMKHLFSQFAIHVTTEDNAPGDRPVIKGLKATLTPVIDVNLTVKDGTFTIAKTTFRDITFWRPTGGAATVNSLTNPVFTNYADPLVVKIADLQLDGNSTTFNNLQAKFKKVFEPGVSYILRVSIRKNRWAGSNIYWDDVNKKLTFDPAENRSNEHYQGVFFKWGSLVGIQPIRSSGSFNFSGTYIYSPAYNSASPNNSSWSDNVESLWSTISPVTTSSNNTDRNDKYLTDMGSKEYNVKKGDICQYIGETGAGPEGYRMPTSNEIGTALGYWSEANPGPVAGGWMRVGSNTDFSFDKSAVISSSNDNRSGKWKNVIENGIGPSGATYQGAYFPTSGWRNSNGVLSHTGMYGYYWTGTIGSNITGSLFRAYNLQFFANTINPAEYESGVRDSGATSCAMPVRCIKKNPGEN